MRDEDDDDDEDNDSDYQPDNDGDNDLSFSSEDEIDTSLIVEAIDNVLKASSPLKDDKFVWLPDLSSSFSEKKGSATNDIKDGVYPYEIEYQDSMGDGNAIEGDLRGIDSDGNVDSDEGHVGNVNVEGNVTKDELAFGESVHCFQWVQFSTSVKEKKHEINTYPYWKKRFLFLLPYF